MRRAGQLFEEVVSFPNLWRGWEAFQQGKRSRPTVRAFEPDADRTLLQLHRELAGGNYRPAGYRLIALHEPKRRLIAAAPVRDRIVHHAIHRVLAPRLDRRLLPTTYACLPGRGSHRAVLAFVAALRRFPFVLTLDIRHYFLSIDHGILMGTLESRLKDRMLLALLSTILASGDGLYRQPGVPEFLGLEPGFPPPACGMPIGNLTSQWWGNHYLDGLDHFVKRDLKIPHYQRYMDDFALFAGSEAQLLEARDAVREWLWDQRRLRLKAVGKPPRPSESRFTYLGYRISRSGAQPTKRLLQRMQHRVTEVLLQGDTERIERSVASYKGVLTLSGIGQSSDKFEG